MDTEHFIYRCRYCQTKNRIPKSRINDNPSCGKCHRLLSIPPITDYLVKVTDGNFQQEIVQYPGLVVLDCWAQWCGPCKMMGPVFDQLAKSYAGRVKVAKLNVEENSATAGRFSIQTIPTILFFKNGQLVHTLMGAVPKATIEQQLNSLI